MIFNLILVVECWSGTFNCSRILYFLMKICKNFPLTDWFLVKDKFLQNTMICHRYSGIMFVQVCPHYRHERKPQYLFHVFFVLLSGIRFGLLVFQEPDIDRDHFHWIEIPSFSSWLYLINGSIENWSTLMERWRCLE